ncbi:MAG: NAD-dependent malic enzyme [Nitrospirota bacterium]
MTGIPSPSYAVTLRLETPNQPGIFGRIATAITGIGGDVMAVDIVRAGKGTIVRDITVNAHDEEHEKQIVESVKRIIGVRVIHVTDRTFLVHHGGKIEIHNKIPLRNRNDLSRVYTPGVGRICMAIYHDRDKAYRFTIKRNSVAIITDGSAVLGLGDIGPEAALPVMEGKAMLFKEFADIDAFPLCLATQDIGEIVKTIRYISPAFGGINLEDISAPRCFAIEERLRKLLDIPVFHDDQHGTAVVVLAALLNACTIVKKPLETMKIVISGAGAAGTALCKILLEVGVNHIIVCDREGILHKGRKHHMNPYKKWIAAHTNQACIQGNIPDALVNADVFIGVSAPGAIKADDIKRMAEERIVFALANPEPEISPEEASPHVRILATGRSDYPNQINNMLCFPGLFRGLLDSRATAVNEEIKIAAAKAIASLVDAKHLNEEYLIPSLFDRKVAQAVASAVSDAVYRTGATRREG